MILECPGCRSRYDVTGRPAGTQTRCRCGTVFTVPEPTATGELTCPNCGAALSPNEASCSFCHTALALAACPRCFGSVFRGSGFCPHCGASVDEPARGTIEGASKRVCPRCHPDVESPLMAHLIGDTLLDECQRCGGLWVDRPAFERLVQDRDRQSTLVAAGLQNAPERPSAAGAEIPPLRYLGCPDCRVLMNRKNFGGRSGVIIEVCKPHGIWFDRDQLSAALRFVMAGGLEEVHRRQIEALAARPKPVPLTLPHGLSESTWATGAWGIAELGEAVVGVLRHFLR